MQFNNFIMPKIRVSCVSFLNSLPFVYGLQNHPVSENIELSLDTPSESAFKLREGIVDIGLIPVAAIGEIKNSQSITNWCISADGPVKSVTLLSHVPLSEITNIILDEQSMTSNLLVQILAEFHWKIKVDFLQPHSTFVNEIKGQTAAVIIGDRSLKLQKDFKFVYDLAGEWKTFTGLPFVFARWVSNRSLENKFIEQFNAALEFGVSRIDTIISGLEKNNSAFPGIESYLNNHLSYNFNADKQKGMDQFLQLATKIKSKIKEVQ